MGKTGGKKARKPREKRDRIEKPNPFDLKFAHKRSHTAKGASNYVPVGKPLAAASKAIQKREATLGVEYKRMGIVNKIKDDRLGERERLPEEEKAAMRFKAIRKQKESKFNLDDDTDGGIQLTHKGAALTEVQRFEKTVRFNDEDEELSADVVALSNFGGGGQAIKIRDEDGTVKKFSRKELIDEIVNKSKHAKALKQLAKSDVLVDTESADDRFKHMLQQGVIESTAIAKNREEQAKSVAALPPSDDYEDIYNTLMEGGIRRARPVVSDKHKAEKEVVRLAVLESERRKRMASDSEDEGDTGRQKGVDEDVPITVPKKKDKKTSEMLDFDQAGSVLKSKLTEIVVQGRPVAADEEIDDFYTDDVEDEDAEDAAGDVEDEENYEEAEDGYDEAEDEEVSDNEAENIEGDNDEEDDGVDHALPELKTRATGVTKAENDLLPKQIGLPRDFDACRRLFARFYVDQWPAVAERLIQCHPVGANKTNRRDLGRTFRLFLRFFDSLARHLEVEKLPPVIECLRRLVTINIDASVRAARSLLVYKRNQYRPTSAAVSKPVPTFDILAFFVAIAELFPTSDFYHHVCSPTLFFAIEVLCLSTVDSLHAAGVKILLVNILLKWVAVSKRYIPEIVATTRLLLQLAVKKTETDSLNDSFSHRNVPRKNGIPDMLRLAQKREVMPTEKLSIADLFLKNLKLFDAEKMKVQLLKSLLDVIDRTSDLYALQVTSFEAIFRPHAALLKRMDSDDFYPAELKEQLRGLTEKLDRKIEGSKPRSDRQRKMTKKIPMIKMLDPVILPFFDSAKPKFHEHRSEPGSEEKRLKKLVRKEKRGAIKELRRDAQYLASKQREKMEELKRERDTKTRRIINLLQGEQSEYAKRKLSKKF